MSAWNIHRSFGTGEKNLSFGTNREVREIVRRGTCEISHDDIESFLRDENALRQREANTWENTGNNRVIIREKGIKR